MTSWLRRVRAVLVLGVTWAVICAVVGGGVMEAFVDPNGEILDMWPQTLAIPGFLFGVGFAAALAVTGRRTRFEELSLGRFTLLGTAVGVTLGAAALLAGLAPGIVSPLVRTAVILGPVAALSAVSAGASLAIARVATRRDRLPPPHRQDPTAPARLGDKP